MSTIDRLEELAADEPQSPFRPDFESLVVPILLDMPQFVQVGLLKPEFFNDLPTRWVIAEILNYQEKYGVAPSRTALRAVLEERVTVDDPYERIFALVDRRPDPRDTPYVREKLKDWLRSRAYGVLFSEETIEQFHLGNYQVIEDLVRRANRIYGFDQGEVFGFVDAVDFLAEEYAHDWLIEGVLVAKQSFMVGGKKKCLKTGVLCDLALSLATGTDFLGHFPVPQPRRVAFFSAESGKQDIQHRMATILKQKGGRLERGYLWPSFDRPQLSDGDDLAKIGDFVARQKIDVVIVDPLYLTLLAGGDGDTAASNLYQMGTVFGNVAETIIRAGATPILCHHFKKTVQGADLDLDDFSMVGAAEFARQSLLIARRGEYAGPQNNQLVVRTHGYGRGDRFSVRIDEGTIDAPAWGVTVEQERETIARTTRTKTQQAVGDLLLALHRLQEEKPEGVTKRALRTELGWSGDKITRVMELALEEGSVEMGRSGAQLLFRRAG
jgi:hypothetical protein